MNFEGWVTVGVRRRPGAPGRDGQALLPELLHLSPRSKVVILTSLDESVVSAATMEQARAWLDQTRDFASVIDRLADLVPA